MNPVQRANRITLPLVTTNVLFSVLSGVHGAQLPNPSPAAALSARGSQSQPILRPFAFRGISTDGTSVELAEIRGSFEAFRFGPEHQRIVVPVSVDRELTLALTRFDVTTPQTRFVIGSPATQTETLQPDVVLLRGGVVGDPVSRVFLALSAQGFVKGSITLENGERFQLSRVAAAANVSENRFIIRKDRNGSGSPDDVPPCAVTETHRRLIRPQSTTAGITVTHGPQVAFLAVDADQAFVQLFPDVGSAQDYVLALVGAVNDIYIRDLDVKLILSFVRLWPAGGEPFSADDLGGFGDYWINNENTVGLNLVHLLSGRRDLPYGGVAYVGAFCGGPTFGISGFLLGGFPVPVDDPDLGNWDVIVSAHEMGHNLGTFHTHDGYTPRIDECGSSNIWARSEIMSYCHTLPGGTLNIDMRFSTRVQDVIADEVAFEGCLAFDCNNNNLNDASDISGGFSDDDNTNNVPDECEDCNQNGTLDNADIAEGMADADGNGVPDLCESNCNANGLPDEYETAFGFTPDANGNRVPDECEPDCDNDNTADFAEIAAQGSTADIDRNGIPDICEDCNANTLRDWADIGRPDHIYVADAATDKVRVYHADSAVVELVLGGGSLIDPYDLAFGEDGKLYVASFGNHRVVRIDPDTGGIAGFVAAGAGGLTGPRGLIFRSNLNLLVSSSGTDEVLEYDWQTGAFLGPFISAGSGGLNGPRDLIFGPNGDLLVATDDDSVLRYSRMNGSFQGVFVSAGSGGLSGPRQMVINSDGRVLIASELTGNVLEYGPNGAFVGQFNDNYALSGPTGMAFGPNGNIYVARANVLPIRIIEYDYDTGRYVRSFIRGDFDLGSPTAIAFRPWTYDLDCNVNRHPDDCDITEGQSMDVNADQIPDECQDFLNIYWNSDPLSPDRTTRSLRFNLPPPATATGTAGHNAIKVTMIDLQNPIPPNLPQYPPPNFSTYESATCTAAGEMNGCARWVGKPGTFLESQDDPGGEIYRAARLQCTPFYFDWIAEANPGGVPRLITVVGAEIAPSSQYGVQLYASSCKGAEGGCTDVAPPVTMFTRRYGDVEAPYNPPATSTQPNAVDVTQLVNKFKNATGAPAKGRAQLQPNLPEQNADISALDIVAVVDAVKQFAYPFGGPCPCPSAVTCGATPCATPTICISTYGAAATCVKTCNGGDNLGDPCINNSHCPGGACSNGFCRDRCGRCSP